MNSSRRIHLKSLLALGALLSASSTWAKNASNVPAPPAQPQWDKQDPARYGTELSKYAEAYDSGWVDQYSKGRMTLIDARGDRVQREIVQAILEGSAGDKSVVRFMTPADIRGVAALIHEKPGGSDDSWLYLPASRRVRRISGANRTSSFQGTEFTYEDLSNFTVSRYTFRFLKDGKEGAQPVHFVEAKPRYQDTGYSRLVISLHQIHFRPEKIEFFDKAGRRLKTLQPAKYEHVHGRFWRPRLQTMVNHQTGKRTIIELTDLRVNLALYPAPDGSRRQNLTENLFTRSALEAS